MPQYSSARVVNIQLPPLALVTAMGLPLRSAGVFQSAGFDVLAMEGMEVAFADVGRLASTEIYAHTRRAFLKHPDADGIYMLGTGWRCLDIVHLLEEDLQVPVVHPVPARVWSVQKRLHVRQPVKGFGRLLEEMP